MPTLHLRSEQGSTFLSASLFAGILAILAAGILTYMRNEYVLNLQGHLWNQALHLSEAGVESALAEMNYWYYQDNASGFPSSRGWTTVSAGYYSKTVNTFTNGNGKIIGGFVVTVTNAASFNPILTSIGTATNTAGGVASVSRAVRVTINQSSAFPVGLLAKDKIDMNGNNVYSDSYDSTDITKSTSGLYDSTKKQSNGNIASNGTVTNSLSVGNADIYGVAYTGIGGSVALGPGGSIGPTFVSGDRATTVPAAQSAGWIQSDFAVDVPNVSPPSSTVWSVPSGTTGAGNNITKDTTLGTGNWQVGNMTLNSSARGDTLTVTGNAVLYVTGNVDVSGLGQVTINAGASLTVYIAGSVKLAGNGIVNNSASPINDRWYGLSTSTSWDIVGNAQLIAAIYAPAATVNIKGAGASGDVSGAVVANKIVMTGNAHIHYDESLRQSNTGSGYAVVSWLELRKSGTTWQ